MKHAKTVSIFLWLLAAAVLRGQSSEATEMRPRIIAKTGAGPGLIDLVFQVPAGYHITDLKNGFFAVELASNATAAIERVDFPPGTAYGEEKVFAGTFTVGVRLKTIARPKGTTALTFNVSYQICQEYPQELCYPPDQSTVPLTLEPGFFSTRKGDEAAAIASTKEDGKRGFNGEKDKPSEPRAVAQTAAAKPESKAVPLSSRLEKMIRGQLAKGSILLFVLVFAAGFLASLTPCVYPVIPIIMGYVGGRSNGRKLKGFTLSLFFVLGLSLVYSLLGVIAAKTGSLIGISFQNPLVVSLIAAVFIVMGLSLAGLFSIPVPAWVTTRLSRSRKSDILGSMAVGGISAIIAAPCVGPVLIALLSWVSQTGNVFLGFWLTFIFSLGMSVIFLVAGTFSGAISALPRGGGWMSAVKYFFAALLIAGGIYFLSNILSPWLILAVWGAFLVTLSVGLGLLRPQTDASMIQVLLKSLALLVFLGGAILFNAGLTGRFFPAGTAGTAVPAVHEKSLPWQTDLPLAREKARKENKRLMVDAWAEWCAVCRELDAKTFSRADVAESLKDYVVVKLDLTTQSAANDSLRRSLGIIGMPTVIFFDPTGRELGRFSGFLGGSEFIAMLGGLK